LKLAVIWRALAAPLVALLVAMLAGSLFILASGEAPARVWGLLIAGTWGSAYGAGQVIFKATPLIFTGLSVAIALRAGLFNVGAEGQAVLGALAAALVGTHLGGVPPAIAVPACMLAAALAGAAWGAIPGLLKATRGAHEVIVTIMLNFVAQAAALTIATPYFQQESVHTAPIAATARLDRLSSLWSGFHGSAASTACFFALGVAVVVALWLWGTRQGFRLRVLGLSSDVAANAGISVPATTVLAMALSGGLAGLAATGFVQGYKYYYEDGWAGGVGFQGIAVALLGRSHPLGIVLAALLLGTLSQGGLAINALVSKQLVEILQAIVILVLAAAQPEVQRLLAGGRR
jgi:simple sugar transport system permease protein